jgi:hypothetical protein
VRGPSASAERQPKLRFNPRQNRIDLLADFGVGEADEPDAIGFEDLCAARIVLREPLMLLAIDLDDKLRGMTVEVGDISIEGKT